LNVAMRALNVNIKINFFINLYNYEVNVRGATHAI
jgi:hypothetical protein